MKYLFSKIMIFLLISIFSVQYNAPSNNLEEIVVQDFSIEFLELSSKLERFNYPQRGELVIQVVDLILSLKQIKTDLTRIEIKSITEKLINTFYNIIYKETQKNSMDNTRKVKYRQVFLEVSKVFRLRTKNFLESEIKIDVYGNIKFKIEMKKHSWILNFKYDSVTQMLGFPETTYINNNPSKKSKNKKNIFKEKETIAKDIELRLGRCEYFFINSLNVGVPELKRELAKSFADICLDIGKSRDNFSEMKQGMEMLNSSINNFLSRQVYPAKLQAQILGVIYGYLKENYGDNFDYSIEYAESKQQNIVNFWLMKKRKIVIFRYESKFEIMEELNNLEEFIKESEILTPYAIDQIDKIIRRVSGLIIGKFYNIDQRDLLEGHYKRIRRKYRTFGYGFFKQNKDIETVLITVNNQYVFCYQLKLSPNMESLIFEKDLLNEAIYNSQLKMEKVLEHRKKIETNQEVDEMIGTIIDYQYTVFRALFRNKGIKEYFEKINDFHSSENIQFSYDLVDSSLVLIIDDYKFTMKYDVKGRVLTFFEIKIKNIKDGSERLFADKSKKRKEKERITETVYSKLEGLLKLKFGETSKGVQVSTLSLFEALRSEDSIDEIIFEEIVKTINRSILEIKASLSISFKESFLSYSQIFNEVFGQYFKAFKCEIQEIDDDYIKFVLQLEGYEFVAEYYLDENGDIDKEDFNVFKTESREIEDKLVLELEKFKEKPSAVEEISIREYFYMLNLLYKDEFKKAETTDDPKLIMNEFKRYLDEKYKSLNKRISSLDNNINFADNIIIIETFFEDKDFSINFKLEEDLSFSPCFGMNIKKQYSRPPLFPKTLNELKTIAKDPQKRNEFLIYSVHLFLKGLEKELLNNIGSITETIKKDYLEDLNRVLDKTINDIEFYGFDQFEVFRDDFYLNFYEYIKDIDNKKNIKQGFIESVLLALISESDVSRKHINKIMKSHKLSKIILDLLVNNVGTKKGKAKIENMCTFEVLFRKKEKKENKSLFVNKWFLKKIFDGIQNYLEREGFYFPFDYSTCLHYIETEHIKGFSKCISRQAVKMKKNKFNKDSPLSRMIDNMSIVIIFSCLYLEKSNMLEDFNRDSIIGLQSESDDKLERIIENKTYLEIWFKSLCDYNYNNKLSRKFSNFKKENLLKANIKGSTLKLIDIIKKRLTDAEQKQLEMMKFEKRVKEDYLIDQKVFLNMLLTKFSEILKTRFLFLFLTEITNEFCGVKNERVLNWITTVAEKDKKIRKYALEYENKSVVLDILGINQSSISGLRDHLREELILRNYTIFLNFSQCNDSLQKDEKAFLEVLREFEDMNFVVLFGNDLGFSGQRIILRIYKEIKTTVLVNKDLTEEVGYIKRFKNLKYLTWDKFIEQGLDGRISLLKEKRKIYLEQKIEDLQKKKKEEEKELSKQKKKEKNKKKQEISKKFKPKSKKGKKRKKGKRKQGSRVNNTAQEERKRILKEQKKAIALVNTKIEEEFKKKKQALNAITAEQIEDYRKKKKLFYEQFLNKARIHEKYIRKIGKKIKFPMICRNTISSLYDMVQESFYYRTNRYKKIEHIEINEYVNKYILKRSEQFVQNGKYSRLGLYYDMSKEIISDLKRLENGRKILIEVNSPVKTSDYTWKYMVRSYKYYDLCITDLDFLALLLIKKYCSDKKIYNRILTNVYCYSQRVKSYVKDYKLSKSLEGRKEEGRIYKSNIVGYTAKDVYAYVVAQNLVERERGFSKNFHEDMRLFLEIVRNLSVLRDIRANKDHLSILGKIDYQTNMAVQKILGVDSFNIDDAWNNFLYYFTGYKLVFNKEPLERVYVFSLEHDTDLKGLFGKYTYNMIRSGNEKYIFRGRSLTLQELVWLEDEMGISLENIEEIGNSTSLRGYYLSTTVEIMTHFKGDRSSFGDKKYHIQKEGNFISRTKILRNSDLSIDLFNHIYNLQKHNRFIQFLDNLRRKMRNDNRFKKVILLKTFSFRPKGLRSIVMFFVKKMFSNSYDFDYSELKQFKYLYSAS